MTHVIEDAGSALHFTVLSQVLEREAELATLAEAVRAAVDGRGSLVLVSGEAGLGKSSLVAAMAHQLSAGCHLLVGRCDDLATPRLLGPVRDLADGVGPELRQALHAADDRDQLFRALLAELDRPGAATVLVLEDVHWADDATTDLLRFLVRRVASLPTVLLLTYRDDLDRDHPLRSVLALAAGVEPVHRLDLQPLSRSAVTVLGANRAWSTDRVLELTGGNPFLVHELLAAPVADGVPVTVVDSVLGRLRRLDPVAREAVERLSVLTDRIDRPVVDALLPHGLASLAEAEVHGLVLVEPQRVAFRHELTRRAIVDALPGARRSLLHADVLGVLEARGEADPAQLVHHAVGAGDREAVIRHGPAAARSAAAGRAHREAAAQYRAVLTHSTSFAPAELAELLQASAIECYTVGEDGRSAVADQHASVALRRELADPVALGTALRWMSRLAWWHGDRATADQTGAEAVAVLQGAGDPLPLALALSNASQLAMLAERTQEAVRDAEAAIALARELDEPAVLSHALNNLGTARWSAGDPAGRQVLHEALEVALQAELSEHAARAYCNLVWHLLDHRELEAAASMVEEGIRHAEQTEHVVFWQYLNVERGMVQLAQGRWADAVQSAELGLGATTPIRAAALVVLGEVAVRTGRPSRLLVDQAWELACELRELRELHRPSRGAGMRGGMAGR